MKKRKIGRNLFYNVTYQVLIVFLPLILSPYLSRTLGAYSTGIYSYNFSIANYFVIFANLGISMYGNRLIASVKDDENNLNKAFCSLLYFHLIISSFVFILYIFYSVFIANDDWQIVLILSVYVASSIFDITWFFFGIEEFKTTVFRNVLVKITKFLLVFIFVKSPDDLWIYTLIMSVGYLVSELIVWPFLLKKIKFVKISFQEIISHFKPNLILFLPVIAVSVYTYMDKIMLGILSNKSEVGFYEYSEKVIEIPKSIIRAIGTVMLPMTTNLFVNGKKDENKKMIEKTMFYVLFISIPIVFGIIAIADDFAPLYFGVDYERSGTLIAMLSPVLLFNVWGNVIRTQYLIPSHRDKAYILSLFSGALINIIVNLILIPHLGSIGAVIGTIFAEGFVCIFETFVARKHINILNYLKNSLIFLPGSIIMFLVVLTFKFYVDTSILNLILEILIGISVYLIYLIIVLLLSKNKFILELKQDLKKKKNKLFKNKN